MKKIFGPKQINFLNRYSLLLHILISCTLVFVVEIISRRNFFSACNFVRAHTLAFLYNAFIVFASLTLVYLVRKRTFARVIICGFWLLLGIINGCILSNRVTPFGYTDLKCISDLLSMTNTNYFTATQATMAVLGIVAFIAFCVFLFVKGPLYQGEIRKFPTAAAVLAILFIALPITTNAAQNTNVVASYFSNIAQGYENYGFIYGFSSSVMDRGMSKPENYSEATIQEIMDTVASQKQETSLSVKQPDAEADPVVPATEPADDNSSPAAEPTDDNSSSAAEPTDEDSTPATNSATAPNIICVLLESVIDPDEIKFLHYNKDPLPTYHALEKEFSTGYLTVPVVGAGTANTEFEILSGMNMQYFGTGEYPYKTILKKTDCESIASDLASIGYATHAVHNNGGNFYSRVNAFSMMGFDTFTSKELMDITEYSPTGSWPTDDILVEETIKTLDFTPNQPDFTYTITVGTHGDYPTTPVIENPPILASGDLEEERRNQWTYYMNQLSGTDRFIASLIEAVSQRDEDTIIVFFGDHLPTMGLENEDMVSGDIYKTNYLIWDNMGLPKVDRDLYAYQLMSYATGNIGFHEGTVTAYHQTQMENPDQEAYWEGLENLQYDILYGRRFCYQGEDKYPATDIVMGISEVTIDRMWDSLNGQQINIGGTNFTNWSKVYVNGKKVSTTYQSGSWLVIDKEEIEDGDIITVSQVGSSNSIFRTSNEAVYQSTSFPSTEQTEGTERTEEAEETESAEDMQE